MRYALFGGSGDPRHHERSSEDSRQFAHNRERWQQAVLSANSELDLYFARCVAIRSARAPHALRARAPQCRIRHMERA